MAYQLQSEVMAYEYMLNQFNANGNTKMVQQLEAAPVTMSGGTPPAYLAIRDQAMHSLGIGTMRSMDSVVTGLFLPSLASRDYTVTEKVNMWLGKSKSGVSIVWDKMLTTDLSKQVTKLEIPVYFLEGIYDYTCNYSLAKSYFEILEAPVKGFYTFDNSAHSPMFEEPVKMMQIFREDVLKGTNTLADIR